MLFLAAILPLLALADASHTPPHLRHRRAAHAIEAKARLQPGAKEARSNEGHAQAVRAIKRQFIQRGQTCRPRNGTVPSPAASSAVSSAAAPARSTIENNQHWVAPTSSPASPSPSAAAPPPPPPSPPPPPAPSPSAPPPPPPPPPPPTESWQSGGQIQVNDDRCGWCNSSPGAPNGAEEWLNCGIHSGGWTPPYLALNQVVAADLNANGIFAPCAPYFDLFRQYGGEFGIPPIMLASFAMQESTCNPHVTGGGGEAGMMQIAPPNCEAGHNCWDLHYNVRRGAQLFSQKLGAAGGNVIQALGAYNGWQPGLTVESATAARWQGACMNQNNLDYLHQWLNGWVQGRNGYEIGSYWNLRDCH